MSSKKRQSKFSYHYISAPSVDTYHLILIELDKSLDGIRAARELLLKTPFIKTEGQYIRPIECDRVENISEDIANIATLISQKLKAIGKLQAFSTSNYSLLFMYVYSAKDNSRKIIDNVRQFRSVCMETTSQQRVYFIKVQQELSKIAKTCSQIETETDQFIDKMLEASLPANTEKLPI
jgi:hypothetical protein